MNELISQMKHQQYLVKHVLLKHKNSFNCETDIRTDRRTDGWMDGSGRRESDNEKLCAMESRLRLRTFPLPE